MKGHKAKIAKDPRYGRLQASCSCGWIALGCDSTPRSAGQAWGAHVYAQGLRTAEAIRAAVKAADETEAVAA